MAEIAEPVAAQRTSRRILTGRSVSILAAIAVDIGLVWLLYFRASYDPPVGEAELFWVRVLVGFGAYAVLQQWTLANQSGRGDDFSAALDKFFAISPLAVAAVLEAYWIGAEFDFSAIVATSRCRCTVVGVRHHRLLCYRHHQSAPACPSVQRWRQRNVMFLPAEGKKRPDVSMLPDGPAPRRRVLRQTAAIITLDGVSIAQATARLPNRRRFSRCFSLRGGNLKIRAAVPPRMLCFAFSDRNGRS